jgi:hypothetical protein
VKKVKDNDKKHKTGLFLHFFFGGVCGCCCAVCVCSCGNSNSNSKQLNSRKINAQIGQSCEHHFYNKDKTKHTDWDDFVKILLDIACHTQDKELDAIDGLPRKSSPQ